MEQNLQNIEITDFAAKGKAIAKVDGKVIFVKNTVPGDVVDLYIYKKRRRYFEAEVTKMITPSKLRTEPFCSHFGVCGGCKWQSLDYSKQLAYKQQEVVDQITRIGHQENFEVLPILPSQNTQFYRNKLEYTFSNKAWVSNKEKFKKSGATENSLGFHVPGRFDKVLTIDKCYLQDDLQNQIRNFIYKFALENNYTFYDLRDHNGLLRNLMFKSSTLGQWMMVLVVAENNKEQIKTILDAAIEKFPSLTSVYYSVNEKLNDSMGDIEMIHFAGKRHIEEKLNEYTFIIRPKSFFQVNVPQTLNLYDTIIEFAEFKKDDVVYDLYCGTGSISIYISKFVKKVTGVEYVEDAIEDAFKNNKANQVENVNYIAGDMHKVLTQEFIDSNDRPDVIVTDPARSGMHPKVIEAILYASPEKIIYVSCNASTQARDIELLSKAYNLIKIKPVDMFPHTHHVENVALLLKKA